MNKSVRRILSMILAICIAVSGMVCIPNVSMEVQAASKVKLNKKSATLKVGQSTTLKLKGTKKKAKWSSSSKNVASVTQKGKVTAKKAGNATITAKIGKKKYSCKIKVKDVIKSNYDKLGKFVKRWGDLNDDGLWELITRMDDSTYLIEYDPYEEKFIFTILVGDELGLRMEIQRSNYKQGNMVMLYMYDEDTVGFSGRAKINVPAYTGKSKIPFTFIDNSGVPKNTAEKLTRSTLNLMLLGIQMKILDDANLTWKDLGFAKFNP